MQSKRKMFNTPYQQQYGSMDDDHTGEFIELHESGAAAPVFSDPHNDFVVLRQPQLQTTELHQPEDGNGVAERARVRDHGDAEDREFGSRRLIPISTIDWQSTNNLQVLARHGIDFLRNIEQVYVQQTIELSDLQSGERSENRYKVFIPNGEHLFYASELSSETARMCCGSNRAFVMNLFDHTQQPALVLRRSTAFGCCSIWCKMQYMEIWMPNNTYIGRIKQTFSLTYPQFALYNDHGSLIYRMEGPSMFGGASYKDAHFGIYSNDGMTQLGSINHQWDQVQNEYNICVRFPSSGRDGPKYKAIVLGAAFLLEYMYFFHTKKSGSCCWC